MPLGTTRCAFEVARAAACPAYCNTNVRRNINNDGTGNIYEDMSKTDASYRVVF